MSTALALAAIAVAVALSIVRSVQERRLRKRLDDRDKVVDRTIGEMRATMREYAGDVDQIYEWAQAWAAEDQAADQQADQALPVPDPLTGQPLPTAPPTPEQAAAEQAALDFPVGSDAQADDVVLVAETPPATSEAWPPPVDDPPTTEIPRVGAHRTDARATRAAGRALREGADEESTR